MGTTTRGAFPYPAGSDAANTLDTQIQSLAQRCADIGVIFSQGSFATRPVSTAPSPGVEGRIYYATDTGVIYYDYGTGWVDILNVPDDSITAAKIDSAGILVPGGISEPGVVRRGKSIIATEESRTNAAYGTLTTPDQVANLVLPTDGLIVVGYQATWKSSAYNAAKAAIFIGASQLKISTNAASPAVQEAGGVDVQNIYGSLASRSEGLVSMDPLNPYTGDVTTGQLIGMYGSGVSGGVAHIFAAAGTYDVSIRFKATSGSVTAKERKLWVKAIGF